MRDNRHLCLFNSSDNPNNQELAYKPGAVCDVPLFPKKSCSQPHFLFLRQPEEERTSFLGYLGLRNLKLVILRPGELTYPALIYTMAREVSRGQAKLLLDCGA